MINQRKKKRDEIKNSITDLRGTKKSSSSAYGRSSSNNFGLYEGELDTSSSAISKLYRNQIDAIQTGVDDRLDAEESNLDILDRGSRYTRKNDKLKKFKV